MENNNSQTIYEEELTKREHILKKVRNGIKISSEERMWLVTHPIYNQCYGKDFYNVAIEHLVPDKGYLFKLKVESVSYDKRIIPIITVPAAKGKIVTELETRNYKGKTTKKNSVKMLGFEVDNTSECQFGYFSDFGLLSVQYECDYFDAKQNINKREASSTGNIDFAMKRYVIDEYTVRYHCKAPSDQSFDALVFSLQWKSL